MELLLFALLLHRPCLAVTTFLRDDTTRSGDHVQIQVDSAGNFAPWLPESMPYINRMEFEPSRNALASREDGDLKDISVLGGTAGNYDYYSSYSSSYDYSSLGAQANDDNNDYSYNASYDYYSHDYYSLGAQAKHYNYDYGDVSSDYALGAAECKVPHTFCGQSIDAIQSILQPPKMVQKIIHFAFGPILSICPATDDPCSKLPLSKTEDFVLVQLGKGELGKKSKRLCDR